MTHDHHLIEVELVATNDGGVGDAEVDTRPHDGGVPAGGRKDVLEQFPSVAMQRGEGFQRRHVQYADCLGGGSRSLAAWLLPAASAGWLARCPCPSCSRCPLHRTAELLFTEEGV